MARTESATFLREKKMREKKKARLINKKSTMKAESTHNIEHIVPRTSDCFTYTWTDELADKPMLISNYPEGASFYDYFFDLDASDWTKFNV